MFKNILKFSLSYSVIEGVQKGLLLLLVPVFTYYMTTEEYGIVASVLMIVPFFSLFFSLLLNASIVRYYFKYEKNQTELKEFLGSIFLFLFLFSIAFGCFALLAGKPLLEVLFSKIKYNPYIIYTVIISVIQPVILAYFSLLKAMERLKIYALLYSMYFTLQIGLILFTVVGLKMRQEGYLLSVIIANVVTIFVIFFFLRKQIVLVLKLKYVKEAIKYSLPIIPVDGVTLVNSLVDRYYLLKFVGIASVGVYYVGVQIGSVIALVGLAINSAYVPVFFKKYESENNTYDDIYKIGDIIVYFVTILSAFVVLVTQYSIKIIFNESYLSVVEIIIYLCFLSAIKSVYFLYTNVLSLDVGLVRLKTIAILIGAMFNFTIGYYLTKHYGMKGAASSTIFSFLITTLLLIYLVNTKTDFKFHWKKHIVFVLLLFVLSYALRQFEMSNSFLSIIVKGGVLVAGILMILYFFENKKIKNKKHKK